MISIKLLLYVVCALASAGVATVYLNSLVQLKLSGDRFVYVVFGGLVLAVPILSVDFSITGAILSGVVGAGLFFHRIRPR